MRKLNYPLNRYIKAIELIAEEKGLAEVKTVPKGGSIVRFELFEKNNDIPCSFWVIHHAHNKKKIVYSKEDYKKASVRLNCAYEELIAKLNSL